AAPGSSGEGQCPLRARASLDPTGTPPPRAGPSARAAAADLPVGRPGPPRPEPRSAGARVAVAVHRERGADDAQSGDDGEATSVAASGDRRARSPRVALHQASLPRD